MAALSVGYVKAALPNQDAERPSAAYFPLLLAFWPLPPDGHQAL